LQGSKEVSIYEAAIGYIKVANEAMARPIRTLTQARGYNPKNHVLSVFGGAGAQHACSIARDLGVSKVLVHRYCGILSAYGLGLADVVKEQETPCQLFLEAEGTLSRAESEFDKLEQVSGAELHESGFAKSDHQRFLNLRYEGTDTSLMVAGGPSSDIAHYVQGFEESHRREFGFNLEKRRITVDNIRVRSVGRMDVIN